MAIEVDGVVVVHAAGGTEREVEIEQCGWRRGAHTAFAGEGLGLPYLDGDRGEGSVHGAVLAGDFHLKDIIGLVPGLGAGMGEQGDETFLEGAEAALDFAFGLGSGSHQMGDAQGAQGALEFALWIGVVGAGAWSEEAEGIGIDGLGQAPGLEGQAEVLEVVPGGVGVHEAAGEVEAGVVVDGEQQGLLGGGGPPLVDGAVVLPESRGADQHAADGVEAAQDLASRPGEQAARSVLGSFLFRGDDVFKPVAVLSGGEKSRLALARLLLDPPNLILMDEPTTHLDIPSIDALIGALEQYEGTVIFISHDVHFIRAVASTVLHISAGQLTPYAGDYQYYLDKTRATSAKEALVAGEQLHDFQPVAAAAAKPKGPGLKEIKERERAAANERKAAAQAKRDREKRVVELEQQVAQMEGRQRELTQLLQNPLVHAPGGTAPDLSRELTELTRKLYVANSEWERELALLEEPAA